MKDQLQAMEKVTSGTGLYEVPHSGMENAEFNKTELRYAGKNPNNYVLFNNELWRIIGLVNTLEGQKVKIRKATALSEKKVYHAGVSGVNGAEGINQWGPSTYEDGTAFNGADLQLYLNGEYFQSLTVEAQNMISDTTWNTGAGIYGTHNLTNDLYVVERGNLNGKGCTTGTYCNDTVVRTTSWDGHIALFYPSDYGYATSGGSTTSRNTCLNTSLQVWNNANVSDCKNNDWLLGGTGWQWTLTPAISPNKSSFSFDFEGSGYMDWTRAKYADIVFPTAYLKNNLKIVSGTGTSSDPFILNF